MYRIYHENYFVSKSVYLFLGKLWFFVDENDNDKFIELLKRVGQHRTEGVPGEIEFICPAFFRHKTLWIHPLTVIAAGIKVYVIMKITSINFL